jgi:hypothetical protein
MPLQKPNLPAQWGARFSNIVKEMNIVSRHDIYTVLDINKNYFLFVENEIDFRCHFNKVCVLGKYVMFKTFMFLRIL